MSYKSPIEIEYGQPRYTQSIDDMVMYTIEQDVQIKVDKDELIKALRYDRHQYEKGFRDGRASAIKDLYPACDELTEKIRQALLDAGENVEFAAVRYGRWNTEPEIDFTDKDGAEHIHGSCSNCGFIHDFIDGHTAQYNFCPKCGAKMDGGING